MKFTHPGGLAVPYVIVAAGAVHATADTLEQAQKIVDMKRTGRDGRKGGNPTSGSKLEWSIEKVE